MRFIKIGSDLFDVHIPNEEAKQLKDDINNVIVTGYEQLKIDLKNTEIVDLSILHPITKKTYTLKKVMR